LLQIKNLKLEIMADEIIDLRDRIEKMRI